LSIADGNSVVLPTTNVIAGTNVTVIGNGSTASPFQISAQDEDEQTLTLSGNNLSISNGNSITLPTTNVTAGTNVTVTGTGTSANPFVVSSNDTSLYAANGTINPATTTNNNRVVNMNNRNIWFNTATSSSNGKIYIGSSTSYPTTTGDYKLYVEGGILTEKVKVALRSTSNWADYVFDEKYNLMPLSEVEKFVTQNKHLPGIDSASELFKSGIDLAEMQSKQMEKIEELTLYIINQNKTLEQQSTALENQNKEIEQLKLQVKALIEKTK
ncbi:MAG: hypothetical protein JNJ52_11980, partial [Flavobacterium sp.]|nr:hypothetical protein [Flavobacterium sp.]